MQSSIATNLSKRLKSLFCWVIVLIIILYSFKISKVDILSLINGFSYSLSLIKEMFPPDFSKLDKIVILTFETISIGFWGTLIGIVISLPLGLLSSQNLSQGLPYIVSKGIINFLRAIPDIMFALLFVTSFGLGPIPGILALSLSTVGLLGKFYAEAIESIDRKPVEALESTGSHKIGIIRHAIIPQVFPLFMGYNFYLLDHNIRVAMVLGLVGAGGLGVELFTQMRSFNYQKVSALLILVFIIITLIDRVSAKMSKDIIEGEFLSGKNKVLNLFQIFTIGLISIVSLFFIPLNLQEIIVGIPRIFEFITGLFPPNLSGVDRYLNLVIETVCMGISGTLIAIFLSIPLGVFSARNIFNSRFINGISREVTNFFRAMPELMFALLFVSAVGLGPFAGVLAIAIHTAGFLGKFYAESIENIDKKPVEAVDSTGASFIHKIRYAVLPQIIPLFNSYNLYLLDRNIRASTVMGVVGAGGIGFELIMSMKVFDYQRTLTIILLILITIVIVDQVSQYLRKRVI
ncbi:MAG: phosphonate ABC transporter, permease protein PhnE [Thermodesulfovibrio sp.]|nr:phosphonate ABC transporter, permease protein PhnE [Thermodesulfovibrio sp.]